MPVKPPLGSRGQARKHVGRAGPEACHANMTGTAGTDLARIWADLRGFQRLSANERATSAPIYLGNINRLNGAAGGD